MLSAISASRGAVRMPLPARSTKRTPSTACQVLATAKKGLAAVERPYPATVSHLRCPIRSDQRPDSILSRLDVVSATPSMRPTVTVRTPSALARNKGIKWTTMSVDTSVRNEAMVSIQMLRGKCLIWREVPGVAGEAVASDIGGHRFLSD